MSNKPAHLLEQSLVEIWSERDDTRRMEAMKQIYMPGIIFYETDAGEAIIGFDAINTRIIKLMRQWPDGVVFHFKSGAEVNHNVIKIAWTLGLSAESTIATGMDIAIIENGLIKVLYLFLDKQVKGTEK